MSLTVVVTRDVEDRYRGFFSSVMLEISAGVYLSPRLNQGARTRVWSVINDWHRHLSRGTILMTWSAPDEPGGIGLKALGEPPKSLADIDGILLVKRQ